MVPFKKSAGEAVGPISEITVARLNLTRQRSPVQPCGHVPNTTTRVNPMGDIPIRVTESVTERMRRGVNNSRRPVPRTSSFLDMERKRQRKPQNLRVKAQAAFIGGG